MSYDVIETFVLSMSKKLKMASYIPDEGGEQFASYLPIEMSVYVEPKFNELQHLVSQFERCAKRIQEDFVRCGYFLNLIKRGNLHRYCVEEGQQGYTNFYKFCENELGVAVTTAKRLIAINEHFCSNGAELPETYRRFGASKLAIMATFDNGLEGKISPDITVASLNKLVKYYQSHHWEVDLDTTWRDDLEAYEKERRAASESKRMYLHKQKFESAKQAAEKEAPKRKGLISDSYKAYTRFFDQTLRSLEELNDGAEYRFFELFTELKSVLKRMQGEVLSMQGSEMLDGL